ncbi:DnaA initiator-associating protein DiaA [Lonepinella sp. MS14434]|uniref:D-sedoheptulose-7-phosphate isomerase n=1 Tax=Lonepinella sp. MS14434 TaxID=3003617 RepID=UPI0036D7ADB3
MLNKINDLFAENIQIQIAASKSLADNLSVATQNVVNCLLRGNKIIVCGLGRSYANAQFLVANLINRYELPRPSFPTVLLSLDGAMGSAIIFDNPTETLLQRQFSAVAQQGDILLVLSPFGNEEPILNVVHQAFSKEISVIALTGNNSDHLRGLLSENDLEIAVPSHRESRILESHLFLINALCELIDHTLFTQSS